MNVEAFGNMSPNQILDALSAMEEAKLYGLRESLLGDANGAKAKRHNLDEAGGFAIFSLALNAAKSVKPDIPSEYFPSGWKNAKANHSPGSQPNPAEPKPTYAKEQASKGQGKFGQQKDWKSQKPWNKLQQQNPVSKAPAEVQAMEQPRSKPKGKGPPPPQSGRPPRPQPGESRACAMCGKPATSTFCKGCAPLAYKYNSDGTVQENRTKAPSNAAASATQ
jgi:hypothetical protein